MATVTVGGMDVCDRLVSWRREQGLSQEAAAERVGASYGAWISWERGRRRPGTYFVLRLAELTGIPAEAWASPRRKPEPRRAA